MSKVKSVLAAAALTSAVIVAVLVLNVQNLFLAANIGQAGPTEEAAVIDAESAQALEERQAQLDEAKSMMEGREADYKEQIESAEQVIADLEANIEEIQAQIAADQEMLPQMEAEYNNAGGYAWEIRQQRDALAAQEAGYASQLEAANQRILDLQAQIAQMAGQ